MARLPPPLEAEFRDPWRSASPPDPCRSGEGSNSACGDLVRIEIRAEAGRARVLLATRGCSAVIAVAALAARSADGADLEVARGLDVPALVEAAGGLGPTQQHAVAVVARAWAGALAHSGNF